MNAEDLIEEVIAAAYRYADAYMVNYQMPEHCRSFLISSYLSGVAQCSQCLVARDGELTAQNITIAVDAAADRLGLKKKIYTDEQG